MNGKVLSTLNDALAYQLEEMYDAETKLSEHIVAFGNASHDHLLKQALVNYSEQTSNKIIKLERILNNLMEEPDGRKNEVIDKLLEETQRVIRQAGSDTIQDVMLANSIQSIIYYKIGAYTSARSMALGMEIEIVSDLLEQILLWECQTRRAFDKLVTEEVQSLTSNSGHSCYNDK